MQRRKQSVKFNQKNNKSSVCTNKLSKRTNNYFVFKEAAVTITLCNTTVDEKSAVEQNSTQPQLKLHPKNKEVSS